LIILDYGKPKVFGPTDYGTLLPGNSLAHYAHIPAITLAVKRFADGYAACSTTLAQIYIAVSINNDNRDGLAALTPEHAHAWSSMVALLQDYVQKYPSIFVSAGIDAEPNWDFHYQEDETSVTEDWIQAYSDDRISPVYDFGSLDGYPCRPSSYAGFPDPTTQCSMWRVDRDYNVSWGIGEARPVPEIYQPNFARHWYIVKRWGIERHPEPAYVPMEFKGVMTQYESTPCAVANLERVMN
jgi:hypothetical protein